MKLTRHFCLMAFLGLLATGRISAQDSRTAGTPGQDTQAAAYDPIVAMMDSLVALNHVVRWNSLEANCYDNNSKNCPAPPVFSDEVYRQRIAKIPSPIPLSYNQYVKGFIDLYANRKRGLTQRSMGLSNLYFPMFEEILDKEGLPLEFKYLSVVESALNPIAVSRVGATGLWQFMYGTGVMYDLKVNSYTDERRDPYKATMAACQYFKDMYSIYHDWLLVIAAYNCGAGNVNKAIKRSGGKTNFWEIMTYLPQETRGYVPAFIAVTYVMNYSREHNLYPVNPAYSYFEVDTMKVNQQVNFNVLADQLDLAPEVISYLNPVYKKNYIPGDGDYSLRLPVNKISAFIAHQGDIYAQSLPSARPVLPEVIRKNNSADEASVADAGAGYELVKKKIRKTHTVRRGETLGLIADKYDVTSSELKKMNRLKSTKLRAGQRLQVTAWVTTKVPVKTPAVAVVTKKDSSGKASTTVNAAKKDSGASNVAVTNGPKDPADTSDLLASNDDENSASASAPVSVKKKSAGKDPKYVYHLVQPGDTLWNIAKRYQGVTVEQIKDINNLRNANIKPGTRLKLIINT